MSLITKAEEAIQIILQQLEKNTGREVYSVYIHDMDHTRLIDEDKRIMRRVSLKMGPQPGKNWSAE